MAAQIRVRAGTLLINAAEHTGLPVGRGAGALRIAAIAG